MASDGPAVAAERSRTAISFSRAIALTWWTNAQWPKSAGPSL